MKSTYTRKFLNALAAISALGLAAFALGLALDSHAFALFCLTACSLTVMIAVHDYAPSLGSVRANERDSAAPSSGVIRATERMPLAA